MQETSNNLQSRKSWDQKSTKEIDEIIQPYYQNAELSYQKQKNKRNTPWDLYLLIFAIILIILSL